MGLISHGVAAGIGYYLAQPAGRRRLNRLRQQVAELAHSRQVTRIQERGRGLAGDRDRTRPTTGRHARTYPTAGDVATEDRTATGPTGGEPAVDPSVPLRGRRLRRQRLRENRGPRPSSAADTGSPEPPDDRAR